MFARQLVKPLLFVAALGGAFGPGSAASVAGEPVTVSDYFTGDLGRKGLEQIFASFTKSTGIAVKDSPIGHEDFKTGILVRAAGNSLPDVFSYWAGARTQFIVDSGKIAAIDAQWKAAGLDGVVAEAVANSATIYNGHRYLVPFGYHYAGVFYSPHVMAAAGIKEMPRTWDDFIAMCKTLKAKGIAPIALGSKHQWPAQFWFDYILLRTAGPEYRARLMAGKASYTDPQVKAAMARWKTLVDAGFFAPNSNAADWTDAANDVARGKAAMTLMGTWITGYWNGVGLKPGVDYDFFPFPTIDPNVPDTAVGPVDGLLMAKSARSPTDAWKLLSYLISDTGAQAKWAETQGALSPNTKVDPSIYSPVMRKALAQVAAAKAFVFNYDLATTPPMAEVGLAMFARFMDDPSHYEAYLADTEQKAEGVFKAQK